MMNYLTLSNTKLQSAPGFSKNILSFYGGSVDNDACHLLRQIYRQGGWRAPEDLHQPYPTNINEIDVPSGKSSRHKPIWIDLGEMLHLIVTRGGASLLCRKVEAGFVLYPWILKLSYWVCIEGENTRIPLRVSLDDDGDLVLILKRNTSTDASTKLFDLDCTKIPGLDRAFKTRLIAALLHEARDIENHFRKKEKEILENGLWPAALVGIETCYNGPLQDDLQALATVILEEVGLDARLSISFSPSEIWQVTDQKPDVHLSFHFKKNQQYVQIPSDVSEKIRATIAQAKHKFDVLGRFRVRGPRRLDVYGRCVEMPPLKPTSISVHADPPSAHEVMEAHIHLGKHHPDLPLSF